APPTTPCRATSAAQGRAPAASLPVSSRIFPRRTTRPKPTRSCRRPRRSSSSSAQREATAEPQDLRVRIDGPARMPPVMPRLENKVAIVTGAAGGIGEASARRFVEEGARVLLVDLDEKALREAAARIGSENVEIAAGDVSDE